MPKLVYLLVLVGLLAGCSAPVKSPSGVYPEDPAISSPQGVPHDLATSYFPARASVNASKDSLVRPLWDCQEEFSGISEYLFCFKAPVLSSYYSGHSIYRLLYLPAFRLPVLLTLELHGTTGVLKTQLVNRYPELMASPAQVEAESLPQIQRINQLKNLIRNGQDVSTNTERLASAISRLEYTKLTGTPLIITEKVMVLSRGQIQQFLRLLDQTKIWQLPTFSLSYYLDGVSYVFEAHETQRYKVISRSNPPKTSSFSQCCRFLLDLSPAKPELR